MRARLSRFVKEKEKKVFDVLPVANYSIQFSQRGWGEKGVYPLKPPSKAPVAITAFGTQEERGATNEDKRKNLARVPESSDCSLKIRGRKRERFRVCVKSVVVHCMSPHLSFRRI